MIKFENWDAIDLTLKDCTENLDEIVMRNKISKYLNQDEKRWFEDIETISEKLKLLKEEMIFTLIIKD